MKELWKKTYWDIQSSKKLGILNVKTWINMQNADSEIKWGLQPSGSLNGEWTRFFLAKMTTLLTSWWGLLGSRRKSGPLIQDQMTSETNDKSSIWRPPNDFTKSQIRGEWSHIFKEVPINCYLFLSKGIFP